MKIPVNLSVKLVVLVEDSEGEGRELPSAFSVQAAVQQAVIDLFQRARDGHRFQEDLNDNVRGEGHHFDHASVNIDYTEVTLDEEQPGDPEQPKFSYILHWFNDGHDQTVMGVYATLGKAKAVALDLARGAGSNISAPWQEFDKRWEVIRDDDDSYSIEQHELIS